MSFTFEVALAAIGTYLLRVSVIALSAGRHISPRLRSLLGLIPAAVLPALVANALVFEGAAIREFGPWYVAFAVAFAVSVATRSIGWTISAGMVAVWVITAMWP